MTTFDTDEAIAMLEVQMDALDVLALKLEGIAPNYPQAEATLTDVAEIIRVDLTNMLARRKNQIENPNNVVSLADLKLLRAMNTAFERNVRP